MLILGLNAYHADSSACLLDDRGPVAMVEEERFRRIKHWAGCPTAAAEHVLAAAGARLKDVDVLAVNRNPRANVSRKLGYVLSGSTRPALVLDRIRNRRSIRSVPRVLSERLGSSASASRYQQVEHHLAHVASSFLVSPYDESVVLSVDGLGDFASAAWGVGRGNHVRIDDRVFFPHSLGVFYQALTQFLGFPNYGDEYKVMGLAPFGTPRFVDELRQVLLLREDGTYELDMRYFKHHRENLGYRWEDSAPSTDSLFTPALEALLGPRYRPTDEIAERQADIASTVQVCYEEAMFRLLRRLHAEYRLPALSLAGGCAMNSVANGKVVEETPFEHVFVQPAAGDAGGALGAALIARSESSFSGQRFLMDHAYWGPAFDARDYDRCLEREAAKLKEKSCSVRRIANSEELCRHVARRLVDGSVVGWFQGRMEWGARALGNRSILADPRRPDIRETLNRKVKLRETFRPFAPSVLESRFSDWYEAEAPDRFMTSVSRVRPGRGAEIPAVTHVDGTGRPQAVSAATNPMFHRLITAFERETGVPMVLNTSFNENEPIVCDPTQALSCFLRTGMDALVLGDRLIERRGGGLEPEARQSAVR